MEGVQVHTSAPINVNSEASSDKQGEPLPSAPSIQTPVEAHSERPQPEIARPSGYSTNPSRTIPPLPNQNPPPPQPGQVPNPQTSLPYNAPSVPAANLPPLRTGAAIPDQPVPPPDKQDLSHPPGYQQQTTSFQDRPMMGEQQNNTLFNPSPARRGGDLLDTGLTAGQVVEQSPIWDTAKSWAKAAGDKLSSTEAQVWKMVNGEK